MVAKLKSNAIHQPDNQDTGQTGVHVPSGAPSMTEDHIADIAPVSVHALHVPAASIHIPDATLAQNAENQQVALQEMHTFSYLKAGGKIVDVALPVAMIVALGFLAFNFVSSRRAKISNEKQFREVNAINRKITMAESM